MQKATIAQKNIAVEILHSAFEPITEDNLINEVVIHDDKRSERIKILMEFLVEDCLRSGEVLLSDGNTACILTKFSDASTFDFWKLKWYFKIAIKCTGLSKAMNILKRQSSLKKYHVKERYIHPVIMGARSEVNGRGTGMRLIKQLIAHYRDNTFPVIIETTTEANKKIYEHFGFKTFKTVQDKDFPIYFLRMN